MISVAYLLRWSSVGLASKTGWLLRIWFSKARSAAGTITS